MQRRDWRFCFPTSRDSRRESAAAQLSTLAAYAYIQNKKRPQVPGNDHGNLLWLIHLELRGVRAKLDVKERTSYLFEFCRLIG